MAEILLTAIAAFAGYAAIQQSTMKNQAKIKPARKTNRVYRDGFLVCKGGSGGCFRMVKVGAKPKQFRRKYSR